MGLWLDDNKHVGGFLCFDWVISATLAGRVTFLLEWGKTTESRQGTCQRGCYRYLKTSRHKEKSVVWRAKLFPQETTSAYQEKEKARSVTNSVCQYHHIYTNIKGLTFLFYFFIQKKKNSRVSQDSPQVKKKIRKTEAERQTDRGLKLSVRFLVISQKAYLKNVQITNGRPRSRKSYNYAN